MTAARARTANPFYQPPQQWQIRVFTPRAAMAVFEEAFAEEAQAILTFEIDEDGEDWRIDIITAAAPDETDIGTRLALIAGLNGIATPAFAVSPLAQKDWIGEVERGFPPLHVGRFYVYGSHVSAPPPQGKIALKVNAGAAFGSGEHATTSGCLLALEHIARRRRFLRPLDMGCGSGILAIAMAKLWRAPTLGIDLDPVSVQVAEENARKNEVGSLARFAAADGYNAAEIRRNAPFDIIVANILARPLVKMAPRLRANLQPGGVAVLSGLLASQERMVLAAHRAQGLRLAARICRSGWNTLVLEG